MNKTILVVGYVLFAGLLNVSAQLSIVPKPLKAIAVAGSFNLTNKTVIYVENAEARTAAKALTDKSMYLFTKLTG